jgi:hypothetical protein
MLPLYGMLYGTYGSTYRRRLLTVSCLSRTGAKWRHQQMAQAVSRWSLTTDSRVRVRVTPCRIYDEQSGIGTGFPPSSSVCPCLIVALHTRMWPWGWTSSLWSQFRDITEGLGRVVSTPALYSEGPGFEYQHGDRLYSIPTGNSTSN